MRTLGYLFGILLLTNGLPSIFSPHFWVRFSDRNLRGYLPGPTMQTIRDFGALSDNAVRALALVEIIVGVMLVFMASMMPSRFLGFSGPSPMELRRRAKMGGHFVHAHERAQGEEEERGDEDLL